MRRVFIGGLAVLLTGAISARNKPEPVVFVFVRIDHEKDIAILRPMIALDIGVQLDSGPRNLKPGTVLRCAESARTRDAIVDSQISTVSELLLDCGDYKFVVKSLDFSPRAK